MCVVTLLYSQFQTGKLAQCAEVGATRNIRTATLMRNLVWQFAYIAGGANFSAAIDTNGQLFTCGANYGGRLGHGDDDIRRNLEKVELPGKSSRAAYIYSSPGSYLHVISVTWRALWHPYTAYGME